jgi:hypothetical protein
LKLEYSRGNNFTGNRSVNTLEVSRQLEIENKEYSMLILEALVFFFVFASAVAFTNPFLV